MVAIVVFSSPGETLYQGKPKVLAVGNTMRVAQHLAERLQVTPQLIKPQEPYPTNYSDLLAQVQREQRQAQVPAIRPLSGEVTAEDVWFLGFPLWFGELPRPVVTALQQARPGPQVVYPFVTHEGGGLGRSQQQLQHLLPQAQIQPGLPIRGSRVARSACAVDHWLKQYYSTTKGANLI